MSASPHPALQVFIKKISSVNCGDACFIEQCKTALSELQNALTQSFFDGAEINTLLNLRANAIDELLRQVWHFYQWPDGAALVAVGGYGRSELHPQSDIDILILLQQAPQPEQCSDIEQFITRLWDLGLHIGHSVRTREETQALAKDDITIATNLIESRIITGDSSTYQLMSDAIAPEHIWPAGEFFLAKWEEQRRRHARFNDNEYNLEPNIKTSPGGLRDIQTILWIAKRQLGTSNIEELVKRDFLNDVEAELLQKSIDFLWRVRFALHVVADRAEDRLLFEHQRKIAAQFGYTDNERGLAIEQFMQEYYGCVLRLAELNDVIIQHFNQEIIRKDSSGEIIKINERFVVNDGYIDVIDESVFQTHLPAIIEVFALMAKNPYIQGVRASTIRLMRIYRENIDDTFRQSPVVSELFLSMVRSGNNVPLQLKRMRRHGVLSRYLPAFGKIVGKMQHDLFHIYTVDVHTMEVVQNIYRFAYESSEEDYPIAAKIINGTIKIDLLYLAALFHDIGKGRGGDHSELGAVDAEQFCLQVGLNKRDTHIVAWLVKHHLLMSTVSQRQDISDPDVIREFCMEVGDRDHLSYLYALTVADVKGTNPNLWNSWRASLMRQLYAGAARALRRGLENPIDKAELIEEKQQAALVQLENAGLERQHILSQWSNRTDEYFLREKVEDIVLHTQALTAHADLDTPLVIIKPSIEFASHAATQIIIHAREAENLFLRITATLEQLHLNIQDARIFRVDGGHILDTFHVLDASDEPIDPNSERIAIIRERIVDAIRNEDVIPMPVAPFNRRMKSFSWPCQTSLANDFAAGYSVLEVVAPDQTGLLSTIARLFEEHQVRLHNAKISTLGERVEDVFYITNRSNQPITDQHLIDSLLADICETIDNDDNPQARPSVIA